MEENLKNTSNSKVEINNKLGVEPLKKGLDKGDNEQSPISTTSHLNTDQEAQVKKMLKRELLGATDNLKKNIKKEGEDLKKDFIIIFGLFASFVSFLSIEVQIFKTEINIYQLIGISSLTLSFIMFFAIVISDISKGKTNIHDIIKPIQLLTIIFITIGIYFLNEGKTDFQINAKSKEKAIRDSVISENLTNKLKIIDAKIKEIDSVIYSKNSMKK